MRQSRAKTYLNASSLDLEWVASPRPPRVFISSKQDELEDERAYVKQRLAENGIESFLFEVDARTSPASPQDVFLAEVESSDVYVGIFYKQHSHATLAEYERAYSLGIPCLIYVKDVGKRGRSQTLKAFLSSIRDRHVYTEFCRITDLDVVCQDVLVVLANALRALRWQRVSAGRRTPFGKLPHRSTDDAICRSTIPLSASAPQ